MCSAVRTLCDSMDCGLPGSSIHDTGLEIPRCSERPEFCGFRASMDTECQKTGNGISSSLSLPSTPTHSPCCKRLSRLLCPHPDHRRLPALFRLQGCPLVRQSGRSHTALQGPLLHRATLLLSCTTQVTEIFFLTLAPSASASALLPGESHGRRSLVGYSPWGRKESDTTERLHSLSFS